MLSKIIENSPSVAIELRSELFRIAGSPTSDEIEEEVVEKAKFVIMKFRLEQGTQ